jgi:UDP-glucuronate 4-epimerase
MAIYKFTDAILNANPITLFNNSEMSRDFTYIDDAVKAIINFIDNKLAGNNIVNVGTGITTSITELIKMIQHATGKENTAIINQNSPGETISTCADVERLSSIMKWKPEKLEIGLKLFIQWYVFYIKELNK